MVDSLMLECDTAFQWLVNNTTSTLKTFDIVASYGQEIL